MTAQPVGVTAIILAGEKQQNLLDDPSVTNRAMIPLAGKTVLQWIVDALRGSEAIERIVVVGDVEAEGLSTVVPPPKGRGSFLQTLMAGLEAVPDGGRALVLHSDIPLLTREAVRDFVARAVELDAGCVLPIIPRSLCESKYPELRRTYVGVREGEFTLGNMALVDVDFLRRSRDIIEAAFAARKSPMRLARMVGFGLLARMLLTRIGLRSALSLKMLEDVVSRIVGGRVAIVESAFPEIGEDMDHPGDLEIVRRIFGESE